MKKLVVSLKRREDRRQHFIENNPTLDNWEFLDAIDGNLIDNSTLISKGYGTDKSWRDPSLNRKLTKGEIGCYLSHRNAWIKCVNYDEPVLILEDDAFVDNFYNEKYCEWLTKKYNFIYLQRNEMRPEQVISINDFLEVPVYPYNTTSYIVTPESAKILLETDRVKNIIPVDEYLPLMMTRLNSCAFKKDIFKQKSREVLPSDVEGNEKDMWFIDFTAHTVNPDYGLESFRDYLKNLNSNDVVFFSNKSVNLDDTIKTYLQFRKKVVYGENNYCIGVVDELRRIFSDLGSDADLFDKAFTSENYNITFDSDLC